MPSFANMRDDERLDGKGRLVSFVHHGHCSSKLLGGAYYTNNRLRELYHTSHQKEKNLLPLAYFINDHTLCVPRKHFEYVSNFVNWLGNPKLADETYFFFTCEAQLFAYVDQSELFVIMPVYGQQTKW